MNDLRVVLYSKYSRMGASSRLRTLQYLPLLAKKAIRVQVRERFSDTYLAARYRRRALLLAAEVWKSYWRRIRQLFASSTYELIWLEGELFPKLPYWLESLLRGRGQPYVVDYDDALFHNYDMAESAIVRWMLGRKIDKVMRDAACVVAGNDYLAERARRAGAKRVEIIPTVVDHRRYAVVTHAERAKTVIGWIGSPATEKYLTGIREALHVVCAKFDARLILVGASERCRKDLAGIPLEILPWSEATEAASIARMDIGIMPLIDGPWERGKCGYKLIQYMACGLPVVASPVGVNSDIVRHGQAGFLAASVIEWQDSLGRLITDVSLRKQMGFEGRRRVEQEFSLEAQVNRLESILQSVASSKSTS